MVTLMKKIKAAGSKMRSQTTMTMTITDRGGKKILLIPGQAGAGTLEARGVGGQKIKGAEESGGHVGIGTTQATAVGARTAIGLFHTTALIAHLAKQTILKKNVKCGATRLTRATALSKDLERWGEAKGQESSDRIDICTGGIYKGIKETFGCD